MRPIRAKGDLDLFFARQKTTPPPAPKDRIIFPLDLPTLDEALKFTSLLKDFVGVFKIGLELFTSAGPEAIKAVRAEAPDALIFLDMKYHDIPETVKGAVRSAIALGVDFVTVHCDEGRGLLKAVSEAGKGRTNVIGITVLTSLSADDMADAGIDPKYKEPQSLVIHRARLARLSGCAGVVCSGLEATAVREEFGAGFLIITPGIRSRHDDAGDQKRTVTPYEAVYNGADYIVVGRPIRKAEDPVKTARLVASEIERALNNRANAKEYDRET